MSKYRDEVDARCDAVLRREIRREWDAINGTLKDLQRFTTNTTVLDRVETLIKHSRELGRLETALKRGTTI